MYGDKLYRDYELTQIFLQAKLILAKEGRFSLLPRHRYFLTASLFFITTFNNLV